MDISKIKDKDLYKLFGLDVKCTSAEIRKAYRKKALECHPDKNPDNPKAGELFNELSEALAVLLDESARAAYDKLLEAKQAAKLRHKELDDRRKKFKEDLEAREEDYFSNKKKQQTTAEEKLKNEIERLRKEGAKLLEEEIRIIEREIHESQSVSNESGSNFKIKIEWAPDAKEKEPVYTRETLERIFHKYGDLAGLVFSEKKGKGRGIVEFKAKSAAELAMKLEVGFMKCPLKLKWMNEELNNRKKPTPVSSESLVTERDYESLVLRKMRQAEERKRLIEQLQKEDGD